LEAKIALLNIFFFPSDPAGSIFITFSQITKISTQAYNKVLYRARQEGGEGTPPNANVKDNYSLFTIITKNELKSENNTSSF
jgi:ABC-type uncharacterized transport system ATPase component